MHTDFEILGARELALEQFEKLYPETPLNETWITGWMDCYFSGISKKEIDNAEKWKNLQEKWKEALSDKSLFAEFAVELKAKQEIKKARFAIIEKYLETTNFDHLIQRIIDEHNDDYRNRCYKRGYEPYPNQKADLLFDYIREHGTDVTGQVDDNPFESEAYEFKNYYFQLNRGQGCYWRIFNPNKEDILTI